MSKFHSSSLGQHGDKICWWKSISAFKQTSHVHSQSVRTAVCAAYTWVKPFCYQWPFGVLFGVPAQNA